MSKTFEFSREGLNKAMSHTDYKGISIEHLETVKAYLEEHPQIVPLTIAFTIGVMSAIIPLTASTVAFKASEDFSIVAFKYVGGGF